MIRLLKNKEFKLHISGLWVARDGEVYVPQSGVNPAHFTYGCNNHGYLQVRYKGKAYRVHCLVAQCWLDNPDNLKTVDHINQNKTDNRIENLRYASYSLQTQNQNHPKNNACSKPVYQYTLDGQLVKVWPSVAECSRNGFSSGAVSECCNGKRKTYKGFIWSY